MADINQTITLGIGTPAGIPEFLTFGLQIAEVVVIEGGLCASFTMAPSLTGTTTMTPVLTGDIELETC